MKITPHTLYYRRPQNDQPARAADSGATGGPSTAARRVCRPTLQSLRALGIKRVLFCLAGGLVLDPEDLTLMGALPSAGVRVGLHTACSADAPALDPGALAGLSHNGLTELVLRCDHAYLTAADKADLLKTLYEGCKKHRVALTVEYHYLPRETGGLREELTWLKESGINLAPVKIAPYGKMSYRLPGNRKEFVQKDLGTFEGCTSLGDITCLPDGRFALCAGPCWEEDGIPDHTFLMVAGDGDVPAASINRRLGGLYSLLMSVAGPIGFQLLEEPCPAGIAWPPALVHRCEFCRRITSTDGFRDWLQTVEESGRVPGIVAELTEHLSILRRWGLPTNRNVEV